MSDVKPELPLTQHDWRGIIAVVLIICFTFLAALEITINHTFDFAKTLLPVIMLVVGFYFGRKK